MFPLSNLSTKTPYLSSHFITHPLPSTPPPPTCPTSPSSIHTLSRHGARHTGDIDGLNDLAASLNSTWSTTYSYPVSPLYSNQLLDLGISEHEYIGEQIAAKYPDVFESYSPVTHNVTTTALPRTGQSSVAQLRGVGVATPYVVMNGNTPKGADAVLRFYDDCGAWEDGKEVGGRVFEEYLETEVVVEAVARFNVVTGGQYVYADMATAVEGCVYDMILEDVTDRFCSLLDQGVVDIVNYGVDLNKYYQYGPGGGDVVRDFTVMLVDDVVGSVERSLGGGGKGSLRFAHAETLIPFLNVLGVFDDAEKLGTEIVEGRVFDMSVWAPFAGNVLLGVWECEGRVMVRIEVNGREVSARGCGGEVWCEWETIKGALVDVLDMVEGGLEGVCGGDM